MCYEQWALNTEGVICHRVGRSQEMRETTVLSHIYPVLFSFVNVVHGKEKSQWNRGGFVMFLHSYSFSKLCITFPNGNFLSAEQDTILKYFGLEGNYPSCLLSELVTQVPWLSFIFIILLCQNMSVCQMFFYLTSQSKNFHILADQVLVTGHDYDPLPWTIP